MDAFDIFLVIDSIFMIIEGIDSVSSPSIDSKGVKKLSTIIPIYFPVYSEF